MFLTLSGIWETKPAGIKRRTKKPKVFEKANSPGAEILTWAGLWFLVVVMVFHQCLKIKQNLLQ